MASLRCSCGAKLRAVFVRQYASSASRLPVDLTRFNQELDAHPENAFEFEPLTYTSNPLAKNRVYLYNDPPIFAGQQGPPSHAFQETGASASPVSVISDNSELNVNEARRLHRFALVVHRVATMTAKGKLPSMYALVVAGNGQGLVGWGQAKHELLPKAIDKAFLHAVKNMGVVERFEGRTIWGTLQDKFGATNLSMWSRPPGFGLRTSPLIHQVAKAAGLRDLSAKVRGSRNGMNTVKLAVHMLQNRSRPVAFGDGFGHHGRKADKGEGMRTAQEIALTRGRRAILVSR